MKLFLVEIEPLRRLYSDEFSTARVYVLAKDSDYAERLAGNYVSYWGHKIVDDSKINIKCTEVNTDKEMVISATYEPH